MLNNFGHNPDETVDFLMDAILDTKMYLRREGGYSVPLEYLKMQDQVRSITFSDLNTEIELYG